MAYYNDSYLLKEQSPLSLRLLLRHVSLPFLVLLCLSIAARTSFAQTAAPATTTASKKVSVDTFDDALARVMLNAFDLDVLDLELAANIRGIADVSQEIPPYYFALTAGGARHLRQLSEMIAPDHSREEQKRFYSELLAMRLDTASILVKVIKAAQEDGGFKERASDLMEKAANARKRLIAPLAKEDRAQLLTSKVVADALSLDDKIAFGFLPSTARLNLGFFYYTGVPLRLVVVDRWGLSYRLGLRSSDTLLKADGETLKSQEDFKQFVMKNVGQKVNITVLRDGKEVVVESQIPPARPNSVP